MKRACRARYPNHAPMIPGPPNRPVRNKGATLHDQSCTKMSHDAGHSGTWWKVYLDTPTASLMPLDTRAAFRIRWPESVS